MLALEDLEASMPPGHLTLEMSVPALPPDLASHLLEDATHMPPRDDPETTEALPLGDLDEVALTDHLTLELDVSEMRSNISSILLDNMQRADPPGDVKSKMSPPDDQGDDEEELLLDLDDLKSDNDKPV
jgi:hypothetical protein